MLGSDTPSTPQALPSRIVSLHEHGLNAIPYACPRGPEGAFNERIVCCFIHGVVVEAHERGATNFRLAWAGLAGRRCLRTPLLASLCIPLIIGGDASVGLCWSVWVQPSEFRFLLMSGW